LEKQLRLPVEAIIFDLDGTLIDSKEAYYSILARTCRSMNLAVPAYSTILEVINFGRPLVDVVFPNIEEQKKLEPEFRLRIRAFWQEEFTNKASLFNGCRETLMALKKNKYHLGIATSSTRHSLEPLINQGLMGMFDAVITREDVKNVKPHSEPVIQCAARMAIDVLRTIYVGDTVIDIQTGKAAGSQTVAVLTGNVSREILEKEHPDLIVEDVGKLSQLLL